MDGIISALIGVLGSILVLAVLVPLGLGYLLARQVAPIRPLRSMLLVVGLTLVGGPVGLLIGLLLAASLQRRWRAELAGRQPTPAATSGLARQWAALLGEAMAARQRFHRVVEQCAPGPLRDSLRAALGEVDAAVAEARRHAEAGSRLELAHRDVLRALDTQRRQQRRSGSLPADVARSLDEAIHAQHDSAERLAAAGRRELAQLQLVVARLHELTAHATEVSATVGATAELTATSSIADRLAALRLATAEVEAATRL